MFLALLASREHLPAGEKQRLAQIDFPSAVERSKLNLWKPGDAIQKEGRRLLVGIATYSGLELTMLDTINCVLTSAKGPQIRVDVFDCDLVDGRENLDLYVPGLHPILHTPIAGLWIDSQTATQCCGFDARKFVGSLFEVPMSDRHFK